LKESNDCSTYGFFKRATVKQSWGNYGIPRLSPRIVGSREVIDDHSPILRSGNKNGNVVFKIILNTRMLKDRTASNLYREKNFQFRSLYHPHYQ